MQKGILFTVLNWGLGHASRSIPIIQSLLEEDNKVTLASDGAALEMLRLEFPELPFIELPGYNVKYSKKKSGFNKRILKQIPHFLKTIDSEKKVVQGLENQFDLIISDNRYGCFFDNKKSIFIGHQLNILFPDSKIVAAIINKVHRKKLENFQEIWIPDSPELKLSGKLSKGFEKQSKYIGLSSRMKLESIPKIYDVCVLVSGPEPQRSVLEEALLNLLAQSGLNVVFIRGLINPTKELKHSNFEMHSSLFGAELNKKMNQSKMVICRSGYSSIMDLVVLNKKALLIPTPGQSEQEYLAKHLKTNILFSAIEQASLALDNVLEELGRVQPEAKALKSRDKNLSN